MRFSNQKGLIPESDAKKRRMKRSEHTTTRFDIVIVPSSFLDTRSRNSMTFDSDIKALLPFVFDNHAPYRLGW
jgi:hypothetical protein